MVNLVSYNEYECGNKENVLNVDFKKVINKSREIPICLPKKYNVTKTALNIFLKLYP